MIQPEPVVFRILETLERLDQVCLEFRAYPQPEFECDVLVGVGTPISAWTGTQTDRVGLLHPLLDAEFVAVQSGLRSNCGESAIIKPGIMDTFPDAKELDRVTITKPVRDKELSIYVNMTYAALQPRVFFASAASAWLATSCY